MLNILRPGDFNDFHVKCVGKHITVRVNGVTTADVEFPRFPVEGILAWQINPGKPMDLTLKDVAIRELPPPPADWVPLFNGKDLTGWEPIGPAQWTVRDGLLCTVRGSGRGWLASTTDYANFELDLQYRLTAGTNSGVFSRAWKEGHVDGGQFMEVQLIDDQAAGTLSKNNGTAALFGVVAATPTVRSLPDTWHSLAIRAQDRHVQVVHDGKKVVEANLDEHAAAFQRFPGLTRTTGRIGLQN